MGLFLALLGVVVLILTVLVGLFALPLVMITVGVVLVMVAVCAVGYALVRKPYVVRLGEAGYRVRFVRGAGVRQARWQDVEDVVATAVADEPCVVLRLRDGRTTTVPVTALAGSPDAFARDLQEHLNQGHGYRRIN